MDNSQNSQEDLPVDRDEISTIEAIIIVILFLVAAHLINYICRGSPKPRDSAEKVQVQADY